MFGNQVLGVLQPYVAVAIHITSLLQRHQNNAVSVARPVWMVLLLPGLRPSY